MHLGILALVLEGYSLTDSPVLLNDSYGKMTKEKEFSPVFPQCGILF